MTARLPGTRIKNRSKVKREWFLLICGVGYLIEKQLEPAFNRELDAVINSLVKLIKLTEEKYSYIYEYLPESERQINFSIREIEILLNYLIYNKQNLTGQEQSVTVETLVKILSECEEVNESFLNQDLVAVLLRTFLNNSTVKDGQNFSELVRVSQEVEDTLAVLRDLALNSIIFSAKAGSDGAGFQILSDRINQISLGLGNEFKDMKATVGRLIEWDEKFQKQLVPNFKK